MTKEQTEACEKLAETEGLKFYPKVWEECGDSGIQSEINCSRRVHYKKAFAAGFQSAQTPEMLMLNPLVKGLVEALIYYEVGIGVKARLNINIAKEALAEFREDGDD